MLSLLRHVSQATRSSYQGYRTMSSVPPEFKQFKLALIQLGSPSHVAENPTEADIKHANLNHARDMINRAAKNASGKPDLVVLPVRPSFLFHLPFSIMTNPRNALIHPTAMCTSLCTPKLSAIRPGKNMTPRKLRVRALECSQKQRQKTGSGSLEVHYPLGVI